MKNIFLLIAIIILITSCGKSDLASSEKKCEGTNGTISGSIDGMSLNSNCNTGALSTIQDSGVDFFFTSASSYYQSTGQDRFNGFFLTISSVTGIKTECIIFDDGIFTSNFTDSQTTFGLFYYKDINLLNPDSENENQNIFKMTDNSNFEICIEEFNSDNGVVRGSISGTLFNDLGESKNLTNGNFNFDID